MKVGKFVRGGRTAPGIVHGDQVHIVGEWEEGPSEWHRFTLPSLTLEALKALPVREKVALSELTYTTPIDAASKVVCIGINYKAHASEAGRDVAPQPSLFLRTFDTLQAHREQIVRPRASQQYDYEGEIVVVIGKGGRAISEDQAMSHVFGYTCLLDGSVRDYQKHSVTAGKNFWHTGAIGPWICTADEVPDCKALTITTHLNGKEVQNSRAGMMIYSIPSLIAYVSRWALLRPGDVIATGTPEGVGLARDPQLWMRAGDRVEVTVGQVGTLTNDVKDEE